MPDLYYGIAAYNEESRIGECLESLAMQDIYGAEVETVVCLNGCNDRTGDVVVESQRRYTNLNIKITHSKKGKVFAHNKIVRQIYEGSKPIAFVDGDVHLDKQCIGILHRELDAIDELQVVGGWPIPYRPRNLSLWELFLYETLHARALFPDAEISVNDVSEYKPFADTHPQAGISSDFEKKSKIYFHGRIFMLRNREIFEIPEDENLADDSFLPNMIHTKYGPGSSRTRYDAIAYYEPYLSLRNHFKAYRRVDAQLRYLDENFNNFRGSREMEKTELDWDYICSQGISMILRFAAYSFIRKLEQLGYEVLSQRSPADLWK